MHLQQRHLEKLEVKKNWAESYQKKTHTHKSTQETGI